MIGIVNNFKDLDEVLPILEEAHKEVGVDCPFTAFLTWCSLLLSSPNLRIYAVYTDNKDPVGILVATIEQRYFSNECIVIVAYSTELCDNQFQMILDELMVWAKENKCKTVSAFSTRAGIIRKYGFTTERMYMTKEVI